MCRVTPLSAESMLKTPSRTSGLVQAGWLATWPLEGPMCAWTATCTLTTWSVAMTHSLYSCLQPVLCTTSMHSFMHVVSMHMLPALTYTLLSSLLERTSCYRCSANRGQALLGDVSIPMPMLALPTRHCANCLCPVSPLRTALTIYC